MEGEAVDGHRLKLGLARAGWEWGKSMPDMASERESKGVIWSFGPRAFGRKVCGRQSGVQLKSTIRQRCLV